MNISILGVAIYLASAIFCMILDIKYKWNCPPFYWFMGTLGMSVLVFFTLGLK